MAEKSGSKPSWQEIQEKKINMAKGRGSRVLKVNSPLGSTMFDIEELMAEGLEIVMAFSDYTARLSKRIRFRYYIPREIDAFMQSDQTKETK